MTVADAVALVPPSDHAALHEELERTASRRLCVGCGDFPLRYFTNLDADPSAIADIYATVPPLPYADGALDEIFAGHFLEHLTPAEASAFLAECRRCLVTGGRLGIVVPDTREVMKRYVRGDLDQVEYPRGTWRRVADLDDVCALFLYSTVQASGHQWSYDLTTLARLLTRAGFIVTGEIDRYRDPRLGTPQWFQCGLDCAKPKACPYLGAHDACILPAGHTGTHTFGGGS